MVSQQAHNFDTSEIIFVVECKWYKVCRGWVDWGTWRLSGLRNMEAEWTEVRGGWGTWRLSGLRYVEAEWTEVRKKRVDWGIWTYWMKLGNPLAGIKAISLRQVSVRFPLGNKSHKQGHESGLQHSTLATVLWKHPLYITSGL